MNKAQNECTCPSGDGSLRWPCPAHPAVEQVGGDERAAFELFVRKHCGMPAHIAVNWDAKFTNDAWEGWKARAALAQPSPALPPFAEKVLAKLRRFYDCAEDFESGGVDIGRHWLDLLTQLGLLNRVQRSPAFWEISQQGEDLLGMPQPSPAQAEQAEAERPEVAEVAFVLRNIGAMDAEDIDGDNVDLRFEDAEGRDTGCDVSIVEYAEKAADLFEQHDRIVGALRAKIAQLRQHKNDYMDAGQETYRALQNEIREREAEIARLDGLVSSRTTERDAALARVAELEKQEPVALANRGLHAFWVKWTEAAAGLYGPGIKLYAAPVVQAQHSVPEGVTIERDVAGTIHIKVGDFDFIQLQYQRPYTDNASTWKLAERIASLLAAAPGKEVGHE
ncbi:TPA: hypothetical protein L4A36_002044 [Pseudomonas aeruginosa]|nr:hypothetical protein [Pseudomonas aeruginosa]HBO0183903.1 hypothetical protein [Pseudomonas aeruginosa]HBP1486264.1 hypothetical protein [Pseudomonas aeruginosa]